MQLPNLLSRRSQKRRAHRLAGLAAAAGLRPNPVVFVDCWADENRILPKKSSSEPGPYRTDRTPYMREVMRALSPDHPCKTVVVTKGVQVGASEGGNNWLGAIMDVMPAPTMIVYPNLELAKKMIRQRIDPMISDSPSLRKKQIKNKERGATDTNLYKDFEDGVMALTGANSAAGLRSMPYKYLYVDELDACPRDVDDEGDTLALAMRGMTTFPDGKAYLVSTPKIAGMSRIEEEYEDSDQSRFLLPCPSCGFFQEIEWSKFHWDDDDRKGETVTMSCEHCDEWIKEYLWKKDMTAGKWVALKPERSNEKRGFFIPGLLSPLGWMSWQQCVVRFQKAMGPPMDPGLLKPFANQVWGQAWKVKGEVPDWETLFNRREDYPIGVVPKGGLLLSAGVDIQKNRIEIELLAHGRAKETWSVAYIVIPGNPNDKTKDGPWHDLRRIMETAYPVEGSTGFLHVRRTAIDAGYKAAEVYDFVRSFGDRAIAIHGRETLAMPVGQPKFAEVKVNGKRVKRGVQYWPVGTNFLKDELYGRLRIKEPTDPKSTGFPPGYCHIPQYESEYFKQLTAEEVVPKKIRGYIRPEWVKRRERNEALDCRIYARAAASVEGIDRYRDEDWDALAAELANPGEAKPKGRRKRKKRGYLDRNLDRRK